MRISIQGGRVIDPADGLDEVLDLHIADGEILARGAAPQGFDADRVISARGRVVCPGLVDVCARLREPGCEHKATIASETFAAVSGGITTLCCPPDTDPVIDTPAVAELVQQHAENAGYAHIVPLGALTQQLEGMWLSEMIALKDVGIAGLSNAQNPVSNALVMRRAMEYAATHGLPVFLRPEDNALRNEGCAHEGAVSTRLGLPGIPEAAETAAVGRELVLVEQTGVRAHFCQLSTAKAAKMIGRARFDNLPVTADVAAHQLHLTEADVGEYDSNCHVIPPLRTRRDRDGLRKAVRDGVISAICSDHQPHEPDAKQAPFRETEPGISALETLLPLTLRLVEQDVLPLPDALARLTVGPANILASEAGTLRIGVPADICIFDPQLAWVVGHDTLRSRGHNTPFLGQAMKGRVVCTLARGKVVYELEPTDPRAERPQAKE